MTLTKDNFFDAAQALYWFAAWNHDGQGSELYRILSTVDYRPGALETGPDFDTEAGEFYFHLLGGTIDAQTLAESIKLILDTKD